MRKRMIDGEAFYRSPDLILNLDFGGRLFYLGLWCLADDSGVFDPDLAGLKLNIFPGDPVGPELAAWYDALLEMGKIIEFEAGGRRLAWLRNFHRHQVLDRPRAPVLPLPPWVRWHDSPNRRERRYEVIAHAIPEREEVCGRPGAAAGRPEDAEGDQGDVTGDAEVKALIRMAEASMGWPMDGRGTAEGGRIEKKRIEEKGIEEKSSVPPQGDGTPAYAQELARLLWELIRSNNPSAREPNLEAWARTFDRMVRLDGRDPQEIEYVIRWCQADEFWFANILSADKLRKQYDQLLVHMARERKRSSPRGAEGLYHLME